MRYLLLLIFSFLVTVPGLWAIPPVDRDEARFVQATKQMVESGDYIDIRYKDETRYKKPIGIYWLQSAAVNLSGLGEEAPIWVYRLVSVLAISAAVLVTCWTGTRLFGSEAGLIAGLVLGGVLAAAFEGRIAKTDATLLAFAVLAQGALAQIYVAVREGRAVQSALPWLFWAAQGGAILIKGPIAPLLSGLTILTLCAADRDWRWLARLKPGRGVLLTCIIVLPWLALITWKSGGAFWQEAVGKDLVGKVAQGQESHGAPPGYYVLTYSLFMWPFGLLAIAAGLHALNAWKTDPRLRFCIAWYIPFWLVLELVPTKLPHYVLPAYPALALVTGWVLSVAATRTLPALKSWQVWLWRLTALGLILVTVALAALAIAAPIYLNGQLLWGGMLAALFAVLACVLAFPHRLPLSTRRVGGAALSAAAAYACFFTLVFPSLSTMWISPRLADAFQANRPCASSVLASVSYHEPSLVFLAGTNTVLTDAAGAAQHLLIDPGCALAALPPEPAVEFRTILAKAGKSVRPLAQVDGLNYSSGEAMSLTLYGVEP